MFIDYFVFAVLLDYTYMFIDYFVFAVLQDDNYIFVYYFVFAVLQDDTYIFIDYFVFAVLLDDTYIFVNCFVFDALLDSTVESRYLPPVGSQNSRVQVKWFSRYLASAKATTRDLQDQQAHTLASTTLKQYVEW